MLSLLGNVLHVSCDTVLLCVVRVFSALRGMTGTWASLQTAPLAVFVCVCVCVCVGVCVFVCVCVGAYRRGGTSSRGMPISHIHSQADI